MNTPAGIYISVPFCKAKCTFCNFASDAFAPGRMQSYVDRLCAEIRRVRATVTSLAAQLDHTADSVYFGGGTPSLLSPQQFHQIFTAVRNEFDLVSKAEITLECAPGQLADDSLDELLGQGLNRISFGVQSFVDRESSAIGRLHTAEQCHAEIARVRSAGLREISLDLIAGLPHQTEQSWSHSLEQAIAAEVPHLSVYMLEVDEDSRLGKEMLANGTRYHAAAVPSEDESAAFYQLACQTFDSAGILQYEISNFARPGHTSQHNLKYWRRHPYIGFGLDAHSMLPTSTAAIRFANTSDLDNYLGNAAASTPFAVLSQTPLTTDEPDIISPEAAFEESLFLGLRLNEGIPIESLRRQFGAAMLDTAMPALLELREAGLLELNTDNVRLTRRGRMISNEVFSRLLIATPA